MKTRIRNITTAEVDRHSNELINEFFEHYEEVSAAAPDKQDINVVFQGWAIQKISSLQLVVVELTRCLNALGTAEADSTPPRPRRRRPRP
jgi:hypothetical protein